uniref:Neurensin 1 n=1 Tax=Xenopus tropicalis TaxID=8364 RepID=A0A803JRU7_XENTR
MSSCADFCGSKQSQNTPEGVYHRYGVRSYLHQFYEDCTASIWEYDDDFQIQRSPSRWSSAFWKVGLILGIILMLAGLAVLAVGFLVPPKIEAFGEDDFVVVDSHAILFCIGGTTLAACLLMSAFAKSYSKEEKYLQQKFKERIADLKAHVHPVTKAPAPGEAKIPVTLSKVQNVQPSSET